MDILICIVCGVVGLAIGWILGNVFYDALH